MPPPPLPSGKRAKLPTVLGKRDKGKAKAEKDDDDDDDDIEVIEVIESDEEDVVPVRKAKGG